MGLLQNDYDEGFDVEDEGEVLEQGPRLVGATGVADFLLSNYGSLRGNPVWMGIGVNAGYTDEKILSYIDWALKHDAGTVWLVLAHELAAENKLAFKNSRFHHQRTVVDGADAYMELQNCDGVVEYEVPFIERPGIYAYTNEREEVSQKIEEYRRAAVDRKQVVLAKIWKEFTIMKASRVQVATISEMHQLLELSEHYLASIKNFFTHSLMQSEQFRNDMDGVFRSVVPNFWNEIQKGRVHMPSAYKYTLEQIFLTYFLLLKNLSIKLGPATEQWPDEIYENFMVGKYRAVPKNLPQKPRGAIYLA